MKNWNKVKSHLCSYCFLGFSLQSYLPAQATIPFVKMSQIDHCHSLHLRLQACRHGTDQWYSHHCLQPARWLVGFSLLTFINVLQSDAATAVLWPRDWSSRLVSCSSMLEDLVWWCHQMKCLFPGSSWKSCQYGTAFRYRCATVFPLLVWWMHFNHRKECVAKFRYD